MLSSGPLCSIKLQSLFLFSLHLWLPFYSTVFFLFLRQRQLLSCIRGGNCPGPNVSSLQLPGDVSFFANQLAVPTMEFAFEKTKAEEVCSVENLLYYTLSGGLGLDIVRLFHICKNLFRVTGNLTERSVGLNLAHIHLLWVMSRSLSRLFNLLADRNVWTNCWHCHRPLQYLFIFIIESEMFFMKIHTPWFVYNMLKQRKTPTQCICSHFST